MTVPAIEAIPLGRYVPCADPPVPSFTPAPPAYGGDTPEGIPLVLVPPRRRPARRWRRLEDDSSSASAASRALRLTSVANGSRCSPVTRGSDIGWANGLEAFFELDEGTYTIPALGEPSVA